MMSVHRDSLNKTISRPFCDCHVLFFVARDDKGTLLIIPVNRKDLQSKTWTPGIVCSESRRTSDHRNWMRINSWHCCCRGSPKIHRQHRCCKLGDIDVLASRTRNPQDSNLFKSRTFIQCGSVKINFAIISNFKYNVRYSFVKAPDKFPVPIIQDLYNLSSRRTKPNNKTRCRSWNP